MDSSQPTLVGTVVSRGPALQSAPGDDAFSEASRPSPTRSGGQRKATNKRKVHFASTDEYVEPDVPFNAVSDLPPPEMGLMQRETVMAAATPQEVVVEYNRALVWRVGVVVTLLGLPLLYFTPIVGLLLVIPCAHCIYWVRDRVRFHDGGDARSCANRDCALVTGVLGIFSALVIEIINVICLIIYLNETPTAMTSDNAAPIAPEGAGSPAASMTMSERHLRRTELALGAVLVPFLIILLRHLHRLRHVLSAVDARSQDLVDDYV